MNGLIETLTSMYLGLDPVLRRMKSPLDSVTGTAITGFVLLGLLLLGILLGVKLT